MKLSLKLILVFVFLLTSVCLGKWGYLNVGEKYTEYGTEIEVVENDAEARVTYKNYKFQLNKLKNEAKVQMWSEEKLKSKISQLSKSGDLVIEVRGNIYSANTKWWEYIVQTIDGQEIIRDQGLNRMANPPPKYSYAWWNASYFTLPDGVVLPFKVYVINTGDNERSLFIVNPQ